MAIVGDVNGGHAVLTIEGSIANSGTIALTGGFQCQTALEIGANTTLTGGGAVTLTLPYGRYNNAPDIYGAAGANFDNIISGTGNIGIGASAFTLVNDAKGVIDATGAMNVYAGVTLVNAGLIEETAAAALSLYGVIDNSTGGTLSASAGAMINLQSADIVGGVLQGAGEFIQHGDNRSSLLDGTVSAVRNRGTVAIDGDVNNGHAILTIEGSIANSGTIALTGGFQCQTALEIGADTTLTGGGSVTLILPYGRYNNAPGIYAAPGALGATLTNFDNTISGNGFIGTGDGGLTLINDAKGLIDAVGGLTLNTGSQTITNMGTIEVSGGNSLTILSGVNNTGGLILAGAGSNVMVQGANITGGALGTAAGGTITLENGSIATVDGTLSNAGTIALASTGAVTSLIFDKNATLTGGGQVTLSAYNNNVIEATRFGVTLTNTDNTIVGSGQLGGGKLILINAAGGVIDANGAVALTIDTRAQTITNAGLIETTGDGLGVIKSAVANTGVIEADGGTLTLQGAVSGAGQVEIAAGVLDIANAKAAENVAFVAAGGTLELDRSQGYRGAVSGFSTSGGTSLDLRDIVFDGTTTVRYAGGKAKGELTVTHGTQVAHIALIGDYRSSTFTLSSDGNGGTTVVDPPAPAAATPPHALVAAMAALGAPSAAVTQTASETWRAHAPMLTAPRMCMA